MKLFFKRFHPAMLATIMVTGGSMAKNCLNKIVFEINKKYMSNDDDDVIYTFRK